MFERLAARREGVAKGPIRRIRYPTAACQRTGHLDVLVNNTGAGVFRLIAYTTSDDWRTVMAVDLAGAFLACQALLSLLAKAPGGAAIVNMSSIRSIVDGANATSCCAAEGAVRLFTTGAGAGMRNNVRVNSIHPGYILTPLTASAHDDPTVHARLMADTPMERLGTPREIADATLFRASDASRYMTGAGLVVDGASTAQ